VGFSLNYVINYLTNSMRKFVPLFIFSLLVLPLAVRAGVPEAVSYLNTQAKDEWVLQALVAAGEKTVDKTALTSFSGSSVNDYAKKILAIVSVGENPRSFAGVDLVQGLKDLGQGGQLGDASLINDDAWGLLALRAAGVAASDPVVLGARDFLTANQGADGGWSYAVGGESDTNDTSAVLMALGQAGLTSTDSAVAGGIGYLMSQQVSDGGFGYVAVYGSDADSTAWVVMALQRFGQDPATLVQGSATPYDYLNSLQLPDGGYKFVAGGDTLPWGSPNRAFSVPSIVVALSGHWYPVPALAKPRGGVGGGGQRVEKVDVGVALSFSQAEYHSGDSVTYTITVENHGPDSAADSVVRGTIVSGTSYVSAQVDSGRFDPSSGTWTINQLGAGKKAQAHVTVVLPAAPVTLAGEVQVRANEVDASVVDQVTKNNVATYELAVTSKVLPPPEAAPAVLGVADVTCQGQAGDFTATKIAGFVVRNYATRSELWYLSPEASQASCAEGEGRVRPLLETFALGITNTNLKLITPGSPLAERLRGRILLQVEANGEAWYVNADGTLTYLPPTLEAFTRARAQATVLAQL
jgi:uncharacterized repeat protein (TIGR01451 family)